MTLVFKSLFLSQDYYDHIESMDLIFQYQAPPPGGLILFSMVYSLLFINQALALSVTEINSQNPVKVELSVFIIDIDGIDTVEQNFEANLFFEARWHDSELTHDSSEIYPQTPF